jgi:hypothetical protein
MVNALTAGDQREVIAFLSERSTYDPSPTTIERIDTHASIIFLAGAFVYKIKRAVELDYLDFSSLEKRRLACERELAVNAATAPELYLGLVGIVRKLDGALALGEAGDVVEWAVKMRRFDQEDLLSHRARSGQLDFGLMAPLAAHIAVFHDQASVNRHADAEKLLSDVITSTVVSFTGASEVIAPSDTRSYSQVVLGRLAEGAELLRLRARQGFVRRCHGDMHLNNIVLLEGQPTLFDAIEFSEDIATVDTLYDLAFLLMDMWHRGLKGHANAVFNRYIEEADEIDNYEGLRALPLFLSVRAAVRAMVTIDALPHLSGGQKTSALEEARGYFASAQELIAPQAPKLISVGGLSGTGKTRLSAALAPIVGGAPGAVHLRSDVERKAMFDLERTVKLGPEGYTPEASDRVYVRLIDKARAVLQAGHSVIIDAVSAAPKHRQMIENLGANTGVRPRAIWLSAPREELIKRVDGRRGDASDADAAVVEQQLGWQTGPIAWDSVDASGAPEDVLAEAVRVLGVGNGEALRQVS